MRHWPDVRDTSAYLLENSVALGSDCGFNVDLSHFIRHLNEAAGKPVALSSLQLLPLVAATIDPQMRIGIMTANGSTFQRNFHRLVPPWMGLDARIDVIGCENIPGFGWEVAMGTTVNASKAVGKIVDLAQGAYSNAIAGGKPIGAFVLECTELPPYTRALRAALPVPVFDSVQLMNFIQKGRSPPDCGLQTRQTLFSQSAI